MINLQLAKEIQLNSKLIQLYWRKENKAIFLFFLSTSMRSLVYGYNWRLMI